MLRTDLKGVTLIQRCHNHSCQKFFGRKRHFHFLKAPKNNNLLQEGLSAYFIAFLDRSRHSEEENINITSQKLSQKEILSFKK